MRYAPSFLTLLLALFLCTRVSAQTGNTAAARIANPTGKAITVDDMRDWNRIEDEQIGADGRYVLYTLTKDVGDPVAIVYNVEQASERRFPRLHAAKLSYDGTHLIGLLKPAHDTVRHVKLTDKKKAKDKLAEMDSLLVWDLTTGGEPHLIPGVHDYQLADRHARSYAYTTKSSLPDSLTKELDDKAKRLVVRNFGNPDSFYLEGVMEYVIARDAPVILAARTDKDSTWEAGIHRLDTRELEWLTLEQDSLDFTGLTLFKDGTKAAWLSRDGADDDHYKAYDLNHWDTDMAASRKLNRAPTLKAAGLAPSSNRAPSFNYTGTLLYFGAAAALPERDSTVLDDEVADVEVWTTDDNRLYTQRNVGLKDERKRTYLSALYLAGGRVEQLATPDFPYEITPPENAGNYVVTYDDRPYAKQTMWEGGPGARNLRIIDLETGDRSDALVGVVAPARFLQGGKYLVWYNPTDTTWNSLDATNGKTHTLTDNDLGVFYDETNDRPMHPRSYSFNGTLTGGRKFIVSDRYDFWELDAAGQDAPRRLTRGRETGTRHFFQPLDDEARFIDPTEPQLVEVFDQQTYDSGFGRLDMGSGTVTLLKKGPKTYRNFGKARSAEVYAFTEADFEQFPDLRLTRDLGTPATVISNANPQQRDFRWGTAENYEWVDNQGRTLKGLLIKPDGFDPDRQYPLLVNFYERNSEGVNRHRTPTPGRSSINYSHYVSKGYVIFNPDIIYREGYPGESAYDCVMSGVTSLIAEGYIDRKRIGAQGHSWGGYQVAYLATKTNLFAAIESGAPVVNMFSAYGGIRWGSGLSRQFQYEHTQSRIGGSPWAYPLRYLENSPIFTADKIKTPILILHNDEDGAVPWYQGIEFYTALRRLGKKAWLLNYRGEPHWPVKTPNRADFQRRMEQFFDHYLMDGPLPVWMERGVAPIERGINQGLEAVETRK